MIVKVHWIGMKVFNVLISFLIILKKILKEN